MKTFLFSVMAFSMAMFFHAPAKVTESAPQRVDLIIRKECLRKPIVTEDCDLVSIPMTCKRILIDYDPSCAQVVIVK